MLLASNTRLTAVASLAAVAYGQYSGWQMNQVNATICNWQGLRGKWHTDRWRADSIPNLITLFQERRLTPAQLPLSATRYTWMEVLYIGCRG